MYIVFFIHRHYIDAYKTKRLKEVSGAPLEYGDKEVSNDIYNDAWPLAQHMTWFIPASARDSSGVSVGDGACVKKSNTPKSTYTIEEVTVFDDEIDDIQTVSQEEKHRSKRGKLNDFETSFSSVASSLNTLIKTQVAPATTSTVQQTTFTYAQMYKELDKVLEKATFLEAIEFLTTTIKNATSQFATESES